MRILQLCKKFPYPLKDGEVIGIMMYTHAFKALGHEVDLLAINTRKHYYDVSQLPEEVRQLANFYAMDIDTDVKVSKAFLNLFTSKSYNLVRFYDKGFEERLITLLKQNRYDFIQLEGLYLMPYVTAIRKHSKAAVFLRAQNVESEIWEREALQSNGVKRWYLELSARRLKKFERDHINDVDAVSTVTARDTESFRKMGCRVPLHVCEHGIDLHQLKPDWDLEQFPSVFHIGSMDWRPNLLGLQWFIDEVWVKVNKHFPEANLYLAGRNFPGDWLKKKFPGVVMMGEVEDAIKFMQHYSVMIVPLHSGSGIRVKLMEGMALGKAIVSTTVGAEGINGVNGHDFLLANDAAGFADSLTLCLSDRNFARRLGQHARLFAERNFDHLKLVNELIMFYSGLLKHG